MAAQIQYFHRSSSKEDNLKQEGIMEPLDCSLEVGDTLVQPPSDFFICSAMECTQVVDMVFAF